MIATRLYGHKQISPVNGVLYFTAKDGANTANVASAKPSFFNSE
jgi:hypothetical protein